ncbi:hypothetical protein PPL_01940 [Heterostelium album PN500]|uniref:Uncharacterized protein n=1 Tax=Heterostelium pallidum (strain ATCC 26659 / Pp 5 / PN500) TaxID=670386 RepID=D3B0X3_HETP5|nr:hypothetical protein PPL_01940 [Heterostelium album PN500]EFA84947.1 hypothetical protein PPL_01940 [Heterostelium album PN500]|eukprot:XP_020437057.1 hypothetical protein PPL_01940 [Heterostelium album PN500]
MLNKYLFVLTIIVGVFIFFVNSQSTPTLPTFPTSFSAYVNGSEEYYFDAEYQRVRTENSIYFYETGLVFYRYLGFCWNESLGGDFTLWSFPTTDVIFEKTTTINGINSDLFIVKKGKEKGEYAVSHDEPRLPVLYDTWYRGEYQFSNFTVRSYEEYEPFFDISQLGC